MYRNAGLGTVVFLGIILIIKMAVIGNRAKPKFAPDFNPNATRGTAPDPNAPRTDLANTTDPANNAPKNDPNEIRATNYDPNLLQAAVLQAWSGQDKEFAATCERTLKSQKDTNAPMMAERVAKICSLRPLDVKIHEAALVLARRAAQLGNGNAALLPYYQMALGISEYRGGNYSESEAALLEASQLGKNNYHVSCTSKFYLAMSLFRQGNEVEAQKLAAEASAKMKPLPLDPKKPLFGGYNADDLILWMAYKETKELLNGKR